MVKDLQDGSDQTWVTLPPVAELNPVTRKIYIANRADGASSGYSLDGKSWELCTSAFPVPDGVDALFIKAI